MNEKQYFAASILIYYDDYYLFGRRNLKYNNKINCETFDIPGGKINENDDDIYYTAVREFFEESGIMIDKELLKNCDFIEKKHKNNYYVITFLLNGKKIFKDWKDINEYNKILLKKYNNDNTSIELIKLYWINIDKIYNHYYHNYQMYYDNIKIDEFRHYDVIEYILNN